MRGYRKEYIVTEADILNAVRYALEINIQESKIVDILMKNVEDEVETVLEDDCEEMTDEMWDILKDSQEG